ncbi:hypothetical protein FHG87_002193 [Trinorchestia longiramus]|nr:hypothetical protein FHG87_002193 [Trinorchestia longiramus]
MGLGYHGMGLGYHGMGLGYHGMGLGYHGIELGDEVQPTDCKYSVHTWTFNEHNLVKDISTSTMNRFILCCLLIGLAASASLNTDNKQAESLLTRYYNFYKELVKDKNFPNNLNREDLLYKLKAADPKTRAAVQAQLRQRSAGSPMQTLEKAFRSMAEEEGFTEEQLRKVADQMIAEGKFPDLREMNRQ